MLFYLLHRQFFEMEQEKQEEVEEPETTEEESEVEVEEEDDKSQYSLVNSQKSKLTGAASIVAQYVNK